MQLSAKGLTLVVGAALGALVWAIASVSPKRLEPKAIRALALCPANSSMASAGAAGSVRIWEAGKTSEARDIALATGNLNDLQFTQDGRFLAVASQNLALYELRTGSSKLLRADKANYGVARFGWDDKTLLTVTGRGEIILIDLTSGASRMLYCCTSIWGDVAFAANDALVVWAGHWPGVLDRNSGSVLGRLTADRQVETFGPIAVDQNTIFSGSQDGRVYWWDLQSRRLLGTSPPLAGYVKTVAVLGRQGWVAYAATDGTSIHLWQPHSGLSRTIPGARPTSNLVYIQNRVAFGTSTGEVQVWDLLGNRQLE